jgi:hypothetical protein
VTSLELEMRNPEELLRLEQVADAAARCFGQVFDEPVLAVESLDALRQTARPASETGQVGVPMRIPVEVERLMEPEKTDSGFLA